MTVGAHLTDCVDGLRLKWQPNPAVFSYDSAELVIKRDEGPDVLGSYEVFVALESARFGEFLVRVKETDLPGKTMPKAGLKQSRHWPHWAQSRGCVSGNTPK